MADFNISMKDLLQTGVHFGHRTRKWNPKMKPYIFTERNGIHILDLQQTLASLTAAMTLVRDSVAEGGVLLFVGTKRQAQDTIAREAERCGMPYVSTRWLGGTLTNWRTIRERIDYLKGLEARRERGEFELLTKKEALILEREIAKLSLRLDGVRDMKRLPDLMFVVDVNREHTAIHEANILGIPIVAVVDTNCDPDLIDHIIPSNDDAIRAIKLMAAAMADAVIAGTNMRQSVADDDGASEPVNLDALEMAESDEALLGAATLAKLESGELGFPGGKASVEEASDDEASAEEASDDKASAEEASDDEASAEEASDDKAGDDEETKDE